MRKVIGIGETIFDIIFKNNQPIGAVPGGSAFNGMISLGRSGVDCSFISETGNDRVGESIIRFARENGVNADNINVFPESKSPISLAFLDEKNDADYLFYKDHPHDQLDFVYPEVQPDDIVMFSSFYAVNPVIRPQVYGFLNYAHQHGAILYYDVNLRPSHLHEVMKLKPNFLENLELADIVRGSKEDFEVLFKKDDPDKVYNAEISFYCKNFIYTQGAEPVALRTSKVKKEYPIAATETVSTIGAGDNFNAGLVYGMMKYDITRETVEQGLTEEQWDLIIPCAQEFSANCCQSIHNSVSVEFGAQKKKELQEALEQKEQ